MGPSWSGAELVRGRVCLGPRCPVTPISKRLKLVNTKEKGGMYLDHLRAVNSSDKVILIVCLPVCMCECVRAS